MNTQCRPKDQAVFLVIKEGERRRRKRRNGGRERSKDEKNQKYRRMMSLIEERERHCVREVPLKLDPLGDRVMGWEGDNVRV